jgi:hypothetical protein
MPPVNVLLVREDASYTATQVPTVEHGVFWAEEILGTGSAPMHPEPVVRIFMSQRVAGKLVLDEWTPSELFDAADEFRSA